jgi:putative flippase GtrA
MKKFKDIIEFIKFSLASGIATIVSFAVLNLSSSILFKSLSGQPFKFLIFDYTEQGGGLGGFLAFLLSFFCAQTVNFIVQRKLVFNSNNKLKSAVPVYILTVVAVYIINLYVPTVTMAALTSRFGETWAINMTNVINIMIQVIIIYPVLKFVVMKNTPQENKENL